MTRNEFIIKRLRDERRQYRGIAVMWLLAAIASVAMAVAGTIQRGPQALLVFLSAAFGCLTQAYAARGRARAYDQALAELGDDPSGAGDRVDYSRATRDMLDTVWQQPSVLTQMAVAYGVVAVMMFAGAAVMLLIADGELLYVALGLLLVVGGVLLGALTAQAIGTRKALLSITD